MNQIANFKLPQWFKHWQEGIITFCGFLPIFIALSIVIIFFTQTWQFFQEVSLVNFLTSRQWTPNYTNAQFGIIVLLSGTLLITLIALIIAIPIGLLGAIYLAEYAPINIKRFLKIGLESLGGIPGVVYGYFALIFLTPFLRETILPDLKGFNALSAGICVGLLIIPIISALIEDALNNISPELKYSGYALGLTKVEVIIKILLPLIFPQILAAIILAISFALGETMIVSIASGQSANLNFNPLEPVQTITSFIVKVSLGTVKFDSILFKTIFTLGFILFLVTLSLNSVSYWLTYKAKQKTAIVQQNLDIYQDINSSLNYPNQVNLEVNFSPTNFNNNYNNNNYNYFSSNTFVLPNKVSPWRLWCDRLFMILTFITATVGIIFLVILLWDLAKTGLNRLNWSFLTSFPSRRPSESGILSALVGSLWLFILTFIMVFPLGIGAAIYLEEYRRNNPLNRLLEVIITNLASIPSIIYGLLGLEIFVRLLKPITGGYSILSGALVLTVMSLPTLIIISRSAIKNSSQLLKLGGYAVGMTREQVLRQLVIPSALPNLLTGLLLTLTKVLAETAALIGVGAVATVRFLPPLSWEGLTSRYTTLPVQIFYWLQDPKTEVQELVAAATITLVIILLILNLISVLIREFSQRY